MISCCELHFKFLLAEGVLCCNFVLCFLGFDYQVLHACYTKVSPSAEVENPQLVAWSESVSKLLELDPEE